MNNVNSAPREFEPEAIRFEDGKIIIKKITPPVQRLLQIRDRIRARQRAEAALKADSAE